MQTIKRTAEDFWPPVAAFAVIIAGGIAMVHGAGGFKVLLHAAHIGGQ